MNLYWMRISLPTGKVCDVSCLSENNEMAEQTFIANLDSGDYDYLLDGYDDFRVEMFDPKQEELQL